MSYKKITLILFLGMFLSSGRNVSAQTQTFNYTGAVQTWVVPCGVSAVTVDMAGAQGGSNGGTGGRVQCTFTVAPTSTLNIYVGGQGAAYASAAVGGFNGGGNAGSSNGGSYGSGGGGASDVRVGGIALANRAIVAGGGGGINTDNNAPGIGGGLTGGASPGCCNTCFTSWSTGGTQLVGGNDAVGSGTCCTFVVTPNGALGVGANGAGPSVSCNNGDGGGGGGGGYYGGGAGGGYGSGAGGSSYTNASCSNVTHTQGYRAGNGYVTFTYTVGVVPPVTNTGVVLLNENTCNGLTGQAKAQATGLALTYLWAPGGQTTDTATGLSAGNYTVTVSSPCGGSVSSAVTITQPPNVITAIATPGANITCNGGLNGSAVATVSGAGTPYTYTWTPSAETTATAIGLSAGIYTVKVVNACGASASATTTITQPNPLGVTIKGTNVDCYGNLDGSAQANVTGGSLPYTYSWTPIGGNAANISKMPAGTYSVSVVDNNGCTGSAYVIITQPTAALATSVAVTANVLCNGKNTGSIGSSTSGGTGPYNYAWTGGGIKDTLTGLSIGSYKLTVTDAHGCVVSASASITEPSPVTVITMATPDNGRCTGTVWAMVNGGVIPYTYLWNPGAVTSAYDYAVCGNVKYCCTITDAQGCKTEACDSVTNDLGVSGISSGAGKVMVYPNPNNGQFTIQSTGINGQSSIEIYNVLGEKIYTTSLNAGGNTNININNQPNGIYLYRVLSTENGSLVGEGKLVLNK